MEWLVSCLEGDCRRYWCLSVGLVWRSVSTLPNLLSETLTSKKEVDVAE